MDLQKVLLGIVSLLVFGIGESTPMAVGADAPTTTQALSLTPIQPQVEYATPNKEEAAQCTMKPEASNNGNGWVVRNRQGEILRRFADTNGDNVVDLWCYYLDGLEVYRDIDSNFNKKADQYRWFHTAGTRWGIDKNEDGKIDQWKVISSHEVAEQVILALKTRDLARFELLLLTPAELADSGFAGEQADRIAQTVKAAPVAFSKLLSEQTIVGPQSQFVDFGSSRPATIPAGTSGSTKDTIVIDNASALVQTDNKHEQVFLGTLVSAGPTWKLIECPVVGANNQPQGGGLFTANVQPGAAQDTNAPSDEMQKLMGQLEELYRQADTLPPERQAENVGQRADILMKLAEVTPAPDNDQWYRQLADMLGAALQSGGYPQAAERLSGLQKKLTDAGANQDVIAHVVLQKMSAEYIASQQAPDANIANLQTKWLQDLQAFVGQYPKSPDTAEALLQLGMYLELVGKTDEAAKWYQQLVTDFPKAESAPKAGGALRRLTSIGKPMRVHGNALNGPPIDSAAPPYRGKVVLIHYWFVDCEPCKADMVLLKDLYAKRAGRDFDIIGVCLDKNAAAAKAFLAESRLPWKHIIEPGGLDGRLANEMGVIPPLMVLVDQQGNVANHNVHVGQELDGELARLIRPTAGTATTPRGPGPR